jgi:hypothetical protein
VLLRSRAKVALLGLLLSPIASALIAVWAEFADLNPPLLLAAALPAIVISTLSAGYLLRAGTIAHVAIGAAAGALTLGGAESGYVAIHLARGGFLNFERFDSQGEMAAALIGIHIAAGAAMGLAVGAVVAISLLAASQARARAASAES